MKRVLNTPDGERLWRQSLVMVTTMFYLGLALAPVAARASDTEVYAGVKPGGTNSSPALMMQIDSGKTVTADGGARFKSFISAMERVFNGYTYVNTGGETVVVPPIPGFVRMGYSRYQVKANDGAWVRYPPRRLDAFVGFNSEPLVVATAQSGDDANYDAFGGGADINDTELDASRRMLLRFPGVMIPYQATIESAYVELTPAKDGVVSEPTTWDVGSEDVGDAAVIKSGELRDDRSFNTIRTVKSSDLWTSGVAHRVDVTAAVQDVVADPGNGWCGGQALALRLRNTEAGNLQAHAWDGSAGKAPKLVVVYSLSDPVKQKNTCMQMDATYTVDLAGGTADIESPNVATNAQLQFASHEVALRFLPGLAKDATINSAVLYVKGDAAGTAVLVENVPSINAALYDTGALAPLCNPACALPGATLTSPAVVWTPTTKTVGTGKKAVTYTKFLEDEQAISFDLTSSVSAIVKRLDWTTNSALGIALKPKAGDPINNNARMHAFESDPSLRAQLNIKARQRFTDMSNLRTVRQEILEELRAMEPSSGGTPIADAYQETMRYLMGTNVSHNNTGADARVLTAATKTLTSGTGRQFQTPITATNQCAGHYILMLASGELPNMSNVSQHTGGLVSDPSVESCNTAPYVKHFADNGTANSDRTGWACMFSTANWGTEETKNQQRALVKTSTVLFEDEASPAGLESNLQQIAYKGQGDAFVATNEHELIEAIRATVDKLMKEEGTITAPGVAVNQLNRLNNLDQLYYALFKPTDGVNWDGNVKRFRLDLTEDAGTIEDDVGIVDLNGIAAVDSRGFFKAKARSWWLKETEADDGNIVARGGVAARLPTVDSRTMYATIDGDVVKIADDSGKLNDAVVTKVEALNGVSNAEAVNLLNWYRGYDITTQPLPKTVVTPTVERNHLAGVLHSRPILVNYGIEDGAGTPAEDAAAASTNADLQKNTIFFSTLEGTLHAVTASSGIEVFSFIPEEKLATLKTLYENRTRTAPDDLNPEFGMDLTWAVYRKEVAGQLEKVYLYGGMRMGGSNYYALDVTNKSDPKVLFTIKGGTGAYSGMGQSWSQPMVASMRVAGTVKPVLIFAGGYDAAKYEVGGPTYPATGLGNQVYIVDAMDGGLIATVTDAEMDSSITSQPKIADIDGDGLVDHIYFGDLGGKVFRLDVDNKSSTESGLVKRVKLLAELATAGDARRFYEPPTVALFKGTDNKIFAAIGLGSGNRSHPLNKDTDDRFHVLFDRDVTRMDVLTAADGSLQATIAATDLEDAGGTVDTANTKGWYLDMTGSGEKVITSAVFIRNQLVWSSYSPEQTEGSDCAPVIGRSFLYRAAINAGFPSGKIVRTESVYGLGADPQIVILQSATDATKSDIGIVTGTDVTLEATGISAGLQRTRWYEKKKQ